MAKGKKKVEEEVIEVPEVEEVAVKPVTKKKVYAVSDKFYAEDGMVINKNGVPVSKIIGQDEAEKAAKRFNK